jgi:hypothetical protein
MHEILGTLSRVRSLPEEFPQLSSEAGNCDRIAKLSEKIVHDDSYWEKVPNLIPLPEDTVEAIVESSASGRPAKQDVLRKLFAAGIDKGTVRITLRKLLEVYRSGRNVKLSPADLLE